MLIVHEGWLLRSKGKHGLYSDIGLKRKKYIKDKIKRFSTTQIIYMEPGEP